jgi:hypothetical protein
MNEKIMVGCALVSVIAMSIFLSEQSLDSQEFIELKKAAYQEQVNQELENKKSQTKPE